VKGAGHAAALGHSPVQYETRVVELFESYPKNPLGKGASRATGPS
jgi:hypothetical protein